MSEEPRHKWFKPFQDASGNPSGLGETIGAVTPRRLHRAKVLRNVQLTDDEPVLATVHRPSGQTGELEKQPSGSSGRSFRGKVRLGEETGDAIRLAYDAGSFGVNKVETLEEREQRHRDELEALKQEMQQRENEAYERGKAEGQEAGHAAGVAELREEFEQKVSEVGSFLLGLQRSTHDYFDGIEVRFVELAMAVARHVVGDAVKSHRDIVVHLASEAIRLATERSRIVLHCNPDDIEALKGAKGHFRAISEGIKVIEFETSPRIGRGGVILESAGGSIDATIETTLSEIHKSLLPDYGEAAPGEEQTP